MRKLISYLGLASAFVIVIVFLTYNFFKVSPAYKIQRLDSGWTVTYRNEQYINTNLEHLSDEIDMTFSRGDKLTLTLAKPLPNCKVPFPYIFFKTQHCCYEVYLDGILIAADNVTTRLDSKYVGIGYNFVALGENPTGRKLMIKLYVCEDNTRASIISPMIGNYDDLARHLMNSVMFPLLTGIFLILFGQVFLMISFFFYVRSSGVSNQIISSIITILIGLWMLTAYDLSVFQVKKETGTFVEFAALYLTVPFLYMFVYNLHRNYNNMVLTIMGYASLLFSLLFIGLHLANVVHIHQFIIPFYILCFVSFIILFAYDYADIRNKSTTTSTKVLMLGLTILCVCMIFYILVYLSSKYVDYRQNFLFYTIMPTGAISFVVTQLLNYYIVMTKSFAKRKEYAFLSRIAYVDNLTGLSNRVSFDKALYELDKTTIDYCIISLDLNGLKEVNDNSGHPAGDRLLKSFSEALIQTFTLIGTGYRVGGDEFVVLIHETDKDSVEKLLQQLDERLVELDKLDPEINHSVSHGYAFRNETDEGDTHSVFMLADQRMYEFKRNFYKNMMNRE